MPGKSCGYSLKTPYDGAMDIFVTAHANTGDPNDLCVNCDLCGESAPLGLGFAADDDVIGESAALWGQSHVCAGVQEYGLREFPSAEKCARYFGLPDDYR